MHAFFPEKSCRQIMQNNIADMDPWRGGGCVLPPNMIKGGCILQNSILIKLLKMHLWAKETKNQSNRIFATG
jgi:hypothetical protein